jgi:hypothetical protein
MPNPSPHFIVTGALAAICHYAQVGTELVRLVFERDIPSLGYVSDIAVNISVAIFAVRVIILLCRAFLAAVAFLGGLEDQCVKWGQRRLVELANWVLARLGQDSPLS